MTFNGAASGNAIGVESLINVPCSNYSQICFVKFALMPLEMTYIHLPLTINSRLCSLCMSGGVSLEERIISMSDDLRQINLTSKHQ